MYLLKSFADSQKISANYSTLEELLSIDWVNQYKSKYPMFHKFVVYQYSNYGDFGFCLMAKYLNIKDSVMIGYTSDNPVIRQLEILKELK